MTTEHRKAPRRAVKEIRKVGTWGNIQYVHVLDCGHTESRPRASKAPELACVMCLRLKKKELEVGALAKPRIMSDDYDTVVNTRETYAQRIRAGIAHNLKIPHEAIDVVLTDNAGNLQISSVVLFLSANDASRIAGLAE